MFNKLKTADHTKTRVDPYSYLWLEREISYFNLTVQKKLGTANHKYKRFEINAYSTFPFLQIMLSRSYLTCLSLDSSELNLKETSSSCERIGINKKRLSLVPGSAELRDTRILTKS